MKHLNLFDFKAEPLTPEEQLVKDEERRILEERWLLEDIKERSKKLEVWIKKGMSIDRQKTFNENGYWVEDLPHKSRSKVWAVCIDCGIGRWLKYQNYRSFCNSCSHSGKKNHNYKLNGINNPNYGRHHSPESIKKMHRSMESRVIHSCIIRGIPVEQFNGFVSSKRSLFFHSIEYNNWRVSVLERDNYTCQECGTHGNIYLEVHHIIPYHIHSEPEYSLNIDNGITLCKDCHDKTKRHEDDFYVKYSEIVKSNSGFKGDFLESSFIIEAISNQYNKKSHSSLFDF